MGRTKEEFRKLLEQDFDEALVNKLLCEEWHERNECIKRELKTANIQQRTAPKLGSENEPCGTPREDEQ